MLQLEDQPPNAKIGVCLRALLLRPRKQKGAGNAIRGRETGQSFLSNVRLISHWDNYFVICMLNFLEKWTDFRLALY